MALINLTKNLKEEIISSPFFLVNRSSVQARAYFIWKNREIKNWNSPEQCWLHAELEHVENQLLWYYKSGSLPPQGVESWAENYELIFKEDMDSTPGAHHLPLGSKDLGCTLCGKKYDKKLFRKIAHLVPEQLGNKWLTTHNECDSCNSLFGQGPEDHLGRMLQSDRLISQTKGKGGLVKYKLRTGDLVTEAEWKQNNLSIDLVQGDNSIEFKPTEDGGFVLKFTNSKFKPSEAMRALGRVFWHLLSPEEQKNQSEMLQWINGSKNFSSMKIFKISMFPVKFNASGVRLWRSKYNNPSTRRFVGMVFFGYTALVVHLPDSSGHQDLDFFPPIPTNPDVNINIHEIDSNNSEYIQQSSSSYTIQTAGPIHQEIKVAFSLKNYPIVKSTIVQSLDRNKGVLATKIFTPHGHGFILITEKNHHIQNISWCMVRDGSIAICDEYMLLHFFLSLNSAIEIEFKDIYKETVLKIGAGEHSPYDIQILGEWIDDLEYLLGALHDYINSNKNIRKNKEETDQFCMISRLILLRTIEFDDGGFIDIASNAPEQVNDHASQHQIEFEFSHNDSACPMLSIKASISSNKITHHSGYIRVTAPTISLLELKYKNRTYMPHWRKSM